MSEPDRDMIGTCAFLATYVVGSPVSYVVEDGERERGFALVGQSGDRPRIWDPERHAFVHVRSEGAAWRVYDFGTAHHFRAERPGPAQVTIASVDPSLASWRVEAALEGDSVRIQGSLGEAVVRVGGSSGTVGTAVA